MKQSKPVKQWQIEIDPKKQMHIYLNPSEDFGNFLINTLKVTKFVKNNKKIHGDSYLGL